MNQFLDRYGWSVVKEFPQDGSVRKYCRVEKNNQTAILMDAVEPEASGNRIDDFIRIGEWLNTIGLKAPEIYEADGPYLLLEDFGDVSFKSAIEQGSDVAELYSLARDILEVMKDEDCPLELPDFYDARVYKGREFLIDWYLPAIGFENGQHVLNAYLEAWNEIENTLPDCPQGFLHIDFHVENLMWLPEEQGIKRCGILDFQGAMIGPKPYDLANLLEDARADVSEDIRTDILSQYDVEFCAWYRVLATMFHCRLMGQFIKIALEQDNDKYLQYLPRVSGYINEALNDPILGPLNTFFKDIKLDFSDIKSLNADEFSTNINKA